MADDHAGVLATLERLLGSSCEIVAEVHDGEALLEAATSLRPDVIVADISMPKIDGLDACRQIKEAMPETKIIILTANNDPGYRQRASTLGASAFVLKHSMADDLLVAIQKAFLEEL